MQLTCHLNLILRNKMHTLLHRKNITLGTCIFYMNICISHLVHLFNAPIAYAPDSENPASSDGMVICLTPTFALGTTLTHIILPICNQF